MTAGDKLKFTIMFRGTGYPPGTGGKLCIKLAQELSDISTIEKMPKLEGRNMVMILVPKLDADKIEKDKERKRRTNHAQNEESSRLPSIQKTGSGLIKRSKAYASHLLSGKSPKRKRKLRKAGLVSDVEQKNISKLIPY